MCRKGDEDIMLTQHVLALNMSAPCQLESLPSGQIMPMSSGRLPNEYESPCPVEGLPLDLGTHVHWEAS